MKYILIIFTFLCLFSVSHAQHCTLNNRFSEAEYFPSSDIVAQFDVPYGVAPDHLGNLDTLRMDFYFPDMALDPLQQRPFILLIHGGSFLNGDKGDWDLQQLCRGFAKRGYVAASLGYRLGHDSTLIGSYMARYRASQDARAAMRFVTHHADLLRVDTTWLFIGGQSAGSSTAHSVIYSDQWEKDSLFLELAHIPIQSVLGGLDDSGNSLTTNYSIKGLFNNWGSLPGNELDADEMVPTVAFHGLRDRTVSIGINTQDPLYQPWGSGAMHASLVQNGICSELNVDTLGGHGIYRGASGINFRVGRAACFFKSLFCNTCSSLFTTDSIPPTCASLPPVTKTAPVTAPLQASPNPFSSRFEVQGLTEDSYLRITTSFGQLMWEGASLETLDARDWAAGIYFLQVIDPTDNQVIRVVKQ